MRERAHERATCVVIRAERETARRQPHNFGRLTMATDSGIAPGSPVIRLGLTKAGQTPVARDRVSLPDAHRSLEKRTRPSMRQSAIATPSKDGVQAGVQCSAESDTRLRQSVLPADSAAAKAITTMENTDIESMTVALAAVVRAYTCEAATKSAAMSRSGACFDENRNPLDRTGVWKSIPEASLVEDFIRNVVVALELDESSIVIGLILLERAICKSAVPFPLSSSTWRPMLLMAFVVASKIIYDEKVFIADYRDQLPHLNLAHASEQELIFLTQINFNTTVRRGQYAKYYYGLEDVARCDSVRRTYGGPEDKCQVREHVA